MAQWVVLELSPKAEGEDPDFIRASIRHVIKDAEVYIPVSVTKSGEDRVINYLVDGYAFIKRAHPDDRYYKLEGSRYVQTVITSIGRSNGRAVRQLACATDAEIDKFRNQVRAEENQGIGVGDLIVVTSGPYRQIQATVIEDIPEKDEVSVHIKLRSKEDIVTLPRSFLRLVQRASKSPLLERAEALRAWLLAAKPILLSSPGQMSDTLHRFGAYLRYEQWFAGRARLHGFFQVLGSKLDFEPVAQKHAYFDMLDRRISVEALAHALIKKAYDSSPLREQGEAVARLVRWDIRWKALLPNVETLQSLQRQAYSALSFEPVQRGFLKLTYLDDVFERLGGLQRDLSAIEHSMDVSGETFDTVLVDGHNLAVRCAVVPGLDTLKDSKGRYTGAIVGFLRSLGSFKKRFPGAEIVVAWDCSNQRRRSLFPDYKANRPTNPLATTVHGPNGANGASPFDQIHWLRDVLPYLGVKQAWNPEEEADDVIATLAQRGRCVVVSTDRDLLQLVSPMVRQFVPSNDKLYDPATVEAEYGVPPNRMVDLRSLDGDSSDNIPGVPGFGLKTAAKLLRLYGTVEGAFASNLAGITPAQYLKLRAAEKQVKLNVKLMTLQTNLTVKFVEPNPDQNVASERLRDVDVKSEPIIAALGG
jgi:5'-3' exonuclease/transcription antitermination factor NusG